MKVVIAGGSGALGRRICARLATRGHDIVVLTRSPRAGSAYRQVAWDGSTVEGWAAELVGSAVINLAGELVDRRPTTANIELLRRSRVDPTTALVAAASRLEIVPPVWIQASTLAIYGDAGEVVLDETALEADGPPQMAGVARAWETAARAAPAVRQVVLRTGIVLDRGTPALDRLAQVVRWGLGGRIASGRQWISWIHIEDFLSVVERALEDDRLSGVVHVTSPNPVRNAELMAALRSTLHRPVAPPTPTILLRIGSLVLRTDPALALTGRRAIPRRLLEEGFEFKYPELIAALEELFRLDR